MKLPRQQLERSEKNMTQRMLDQLFSVHCKNITLKNTSYQIKSNFDPEVDLNVAVEKKTIDIYEH